MSCGGAAAAASWPAIVAAAARDQQLSRSVVWNVVDWYDNSFKTTNELAPRPAGRGEGSPHLLRGRRGVGVRAEPAITLPPCSRPW